MEFNEANALIDKIGAVSIMEIAERKYLFELASDKSNSPVMEVGAAAGGTTILLAIAAGHCYALDSGRGEDHRLWFHKNLAKANVQHLVDFLPADSVEAAGRFPDHFFGMVLVDAEHTGENPYLDLMAWAPKVKPGGYLLADDLRDGTPDVTIGVIRFLTENHDFGYDRAFRRSQGGFEQVKLLSLKRNSACGRVHNYNPPCKDEA